MIEALSERFRRAYVIVTSATLVPVVVRLAVFAALLGALAVTMPPSVIEPRTVLPLLLVAAVPALAPRGSTTTLAIVAIVIAWVVTTAGAGERIALWRPLTLAGCLYLAHSLAALAAVLPTDAVVSADVLARWVARVAGVVLTASVLAVPMVSVSGIGGAETLLTAGVVGLGVAVGAAALLAWMVRRRA
jgi:hypothetical protein